MQRLYLRKTDPKKMQENPKLPYFTLVLPPEEDSNEDWKEVGALWKAKTGNGYSGKTSKGVVISVTEDEDEKPEDPVEELGKAIKPGEQGD